jgi:hypothetical protein
MHFHIPRTSPKPGEKQDKKERKGKEAPFEIKTRRIFRSVAIDMSVVFVGLPSFCFWRTALR